MASTINATTGLLGGIVSTGDTSGQLELQADGTTKLTVSSSGVTIPTLVGANVNLASNVTGTLPVANGGTGATTLTGYVKGAGTSALSASSTIPGSDISGNISGNAANVTGTIAVANGGTGATSFTANNVLLGNGTSALQTVAPGSSGNVLTSNGTTWQSTAPAGGGSWVYITSVTGTNASTIDLDYAFNNTYDIYIITGSGMATTSTSADQILMYVKTTGSGSYRTSGYNYKRIPYNSNTITSSSSSFIETGLILARNTTTTGSNMIMYLWQPGQVNYPSAFWQGNGYFENFGLGSYYNGNFSEAVTGYRFTAANGNIYGTFRLYGLKTS